MQTPVYAHAVVHEVSDQDHVFEGVPMAQAIPIYPFPNGFVCPFVPASGVKNSLDDGAGRASCGATGSGRRRRRVHPEDDARQKAQTEPPLRPGRESQPGRRRRATNTM